jgi:hypothetical protein
LIVTSGSTEPYELIGLMREGGRLRLQVQARVLKNGQRIAAFKMVSVASG